MFAGPWFHISQACFLKDIFIVKISKTWQPISRCRPDHSQHQNLLCKITVLSSSKVDVWHLLKDTFCVCLQSLWQDCSKWLSTLPPWPWRPSSSTCPCPALTFSRGTPLQWVSPSSSYFFRSGSFMNTPRDRGFEANLCIQFSLMTDHPSVREWNFERLAYLEKIIHVLNFNPNLLLGLARD